MTVLHRVTGVAALAACLARAGAEDAILLIEDGVYAALDRTAIERAKPRMLYVLREHLALRGLDAGRVEPAVTRVDVPGFVALAVRHAHSMEWH